MPSRQPLNVTRAPPNLPTPLATQGPTPGPTRLCKKRWPLNRKRGPSSGISCPTFAWPHCPSGRLIDRPRARQNGREADACTYSCSLTGGAHLGSRATGAEYKQTSLRLLNTFNSLRSWHDVRNGGITTATGHVAAGRHTPFLPTQIIHNKPQKSLLK